MSSTRRDKIKSRVDDLPISESTRLLSKDELSSIVESGGKGYDEIENLPRTTLVLSFSLLVQSYLLVSVFPYSGFLAMHLIQGLNEETAGSYAGLIASSFMAGRTFSSFEWGKAADRYGRVFVIKMSLLLSAVFSILFGLAPTFSMALILRFLLGLSNGLIGPVKTLVSEYARGDQNKETKMMAIVLGMWGYGFLINPAISGYLSDPVKQYPDAECVKILRPMLEKFPFFLPNLVGFFFCLVGYGLIHKFAEETLPEEKRQQFRLPSILPFIKNDHPMMRNVSSWGLFKHLHNSEGEISEELNTMLSPYQEKDRRVIERDGKEDTASIQSLMQREGTRQHLVVYWGYSFLIVTIDEVFPLFCISKASGLGITERTIGNILSGTGLLFVCIQYFLITRLVDRTLYAIIRSFSSVVFSTISMTTNRTVPANQRASINGLSMLGGSLAKAVGPLYGGILFSTSVSHVPPPFGSVVVYSTTAILGICLGVHAYFLREYDDHEKESTETAENESLNLELGVEEEPPRF